LQRFAIDFLRKKGFKLVEPPLMLHHKPYSGVTSLKAFEEVMYKIENEDLYLIATSEHAIASMFMDETLLEDELPIKLTGVSPCFRKEVGTHGKYTKGLFRMHQFNKVEQFIFCKPEDSAKYFNELQKNSEEMFRLLGIPYRTVLLCSADTGSVAAKTYDIEILMADKQYREVGSNSNCTDYQARRLNIKYKEKEGMAPKGFVHTLNNTGIATSRAMIAIIENNQQKDGSIKIPKVLQKYTEFKEIKAKKVKK
jgi:seryl-tRNA synthetase